MTDDDYQNGWNDRRYFEAVILAALNLPNLTDEERALLLRIREELLNEKKIADD